MTKKSNTFNKVTRKFSFRLPLELDAALETMMVETGKAKTALMIDAINLMLASCQNSTNRA
jgi:predicted DNA-binding protein